MEKLFTVEEANVLTVAGFSAYYNKLYKKGEITRVQAYEQTEAIHQRVHLSRKRKYSDLTSFLRRAKLGNRQPSPAV